MPEYTRKIAIVAILMLGLSGPAGAASYFVQDSITSNNPLAILGGLEVDGQTSKTTSHDDGTTHIATGANLADGRLNGSLHSEGEDAIRGTRSVFGDRVTIVDGAGTNVDFNFLFDAQIAAAAESLGTTSMLFTGSARFAVFDPSAGANAGNWTRLAFPVFGGGDQSLGKDLASFGYRSDDLPITAMLNEMLSVTLPILSDNQSFDIFASLSATVLGGDNPIDLDLEFSSLASLGLAPGVTISSASGAFLTQGANAAPQALAPVPLPASALLLFGAIGLLGWGVRLKRMHALK